MRISFILPGLIKIPIGGVKIIYRYASELGELGHSITIYSPLYEGDTLYYFFKSKAIQLRDIFHQINNKPYYKTPKGVSHLIIPHVSSKYIGDSDIIIATGWQTAYWVNALPLTKGKKCYFIQNYETYQGNRKLIHNTWRLPLKKLLLQHG